MSTIDRILQLVEESGLTAKEYALNAGLGAGNITDWKTGRSKPSVESLQKIAKYANVQLEWLTGDSEFKTPKEAFDDYMIYQNKILILKTIDRYYYEFIVPCSIKEKDVDFIVETLSNVTEENVKEKKLQIDSYVDSFNEDIKGKVRKLLNIIVRELMDDVKQKSIFYNLNSLVNKDIKNNAEPSSKLYMCPVYGRISAGQPNWAEECIEGRIPIDPDMMNIHNPEECFFLRVNGESMNKVVKDGAYALIRKTDVVDDGDIAVVLVNGYDATLKVFNRQEDFILLEPMSTDASFKTQVYGKDTEIKVIGKYLGKMEFNN